MRRLLRGLVHAVSLLSLLACLAAGWLWWRSDRVEDHLSWYVVGRQARYTIRSDRGRVTLYAPPARPAARGRSGAGETADVLVARLSNRGLVWQVERPPRQPAPPDWVVGGTSAPAYQSPDDGTWLDLLSGGVPFDDHPRRFADAELVPLLLGCLEEPDRFAAAHLVLARMFGQWRHFDPAGLGWEERADGSFVQTVSGLRAELRPDPTVAASRETKSRIVVEIWTCVATIDPAQLPALRDRWHRRLDVPVASVGYRWVVAGAALPPLLWLAARGRRAWVRRRRRRLGLCLRCGYDLRGNTSGQCSECGEETQ